MSEVTLPKSEVAFADLGLNPLLLRAVEAYPFATPIQAEAIPPILEGRDVVGQAQTGTGKTAAFAIPMLQRIDLNRPTPQVLVLTPTRELAIQVAESFEKYGAHLPGLRVTSIYGGQDYQVQFRQLDRGVHVVVGTPGRVMDHLRRGSLRLDGMHAFVLDEADEMLKMGFAEDVEWILTQAPQERQIALFSATMPPAIRRIAEQHLRSPAEITIRQVSATADTVRQRFIVAPPRVKFDVLARVLEAEETDGVIIFVRTRSTTEPLADFLNSIGYRTGALSSDVAQKQREKIVDALRSGKLDIVIATDVAARGLDVQRISHVINYDLPRDSESYVHRIGRTGRAGRTGNAILFLHPKERPLLRRLENATRREIEPMEVPTKREINRRRVSKFHERITTALAHPELGTIQSLIEQYRREHPEVTVEQIAAALGAISTGDGPLLLTEELPPIGGFADRRDARFDDQGPRRFERGDRGDRMERGGERFGDRRNDERFARERPPRRTDEMETFRVEVGRQHDVKPGNLVGAIANETGLQSSLIGRIEIFEDFSTVDLLAGMPDDIFDSLKRVWVAGRQLNISRVGSEQRRPRREFSPEGGGPRGRARRPARRDGFAPEAASR